MNPICVVEDDAALLEALGMILQEEGYDVIACSDAPSALAAQQRSPAVYLIDLHLAGEMNGEALIKVLRQQTGGTATPIIIMSGAADGEQRAGQLGVAYLPKPSSVDAVLEAIEKVVTRA